MSEGKNILNIVSEETFDEKMTALIDAVTEKSQLKPRVDELEQVINGDDSTPGIVETLENKVDKTEGKDLSSNDFTDALLDKLNNIESNANRYIHPEKHQISEIENLIKSLDSKQPVGDYAMKSELTAEVSRAKQAEEHNAQQISILVGNLEGDSNKSVREIASEIAQTEVGTLIGAAPEALDTLKEVADWIETDKTGTAAMVADISSLKSTTTSQGNRISTLEGKHLYMHRVYFN